MGDHYGGDSEHQKWNDAAEDRLRAAAESRDKIKSLRSGVRMVGRLSYLVGTGALLSGGGLMASGNALGGGALLAGGAMCEVLGVVLTTAASEKS